MSWLTEPFALPFMQRALIAAVIVGVVCAILGCYVVLRSMAFLGDALAHAVLPGVALAYLAGVNMLLGALVAAVLVSLGVSAFTRHGTLREDTAIGIVFAAALALGVLLISTVHTYATDLTHILFGDLLGVAQTDLLISGGLAVLVLGTVAALYKEFLLVSFDPVLAHTLGKKPGVYRTLLVLLIAVAIVISLRTVGVGLVVALLVTPAATAYLLTTRLPAMMAVSTACGVASALIGLYASYYLDVSSGAAVVLVATGFFLLAYLFAPRRGLVWRLRRATV